MFCTFTAFCWWKEKPTSSVIDERLLTGLSFSLCSYWLSPCFAMRASIDWRGERLPVQRVWQWGGPALKKIFSERQTAPCLSSFACSELVEWRGGAHREKGTGVSSLILPAIETTVLLAGGAPSSSFWSQNHVMKLQIPALGWQNSVVKDQRMARINSLLHDLTRG